MKPTSTQKEVIETSKRLVNYWLSTNDLDSSYHINVIEDEVSAIDSLSTNEQLLIINNLVDLLKTIRYLGV